MDFGQDAGGRGKRERRKPVEAEPPAPAEGGAEEGAEQAEGGAAAAPAAAAPTAAPASAPSSSGASSSGAPAQTAVEKLAAEAARLASAAAEAAASEKVPAMAEAAKKSSRRGKDGGDEADDDGKGERKAKAEPVAHRRETVQQREQVMQQLQPLQQLLMLGFLPEEADLSVWSSYGTLQNGALEIRRSLVSKVIGEYALGRGLFARRDFAANELITVYGGELITAEEAKLRKETRESQSRRYLMRISDSDFLVDGWQYATGINDEPGEDGICLPTSADSTQWLQGCAPMANHDPANHNAYLSFVPLGTAEALKLLPRIPTLRAHRKIVAGEEILFNYGSSLPFMPKMVQPQAEEPEAADEEAETLSLSKTWTDLDWGHHGLDAGKLRALLHDFRHVVNVKSMYKQQYATAARVFTILLATKHNAPEMLLKEVVRLLSEVMQATDRIHKCSRQQHRTRQESHADAPETKELGAMVEQLVQLKKIMRAAKARYEKVIDPDRVSPKHDWEPLEEVAPVAPADAKAKRGRGKQAAAEEAEAAA